MARKEILKVELAKRPAIHEPFGRPNDWRPNLAQDLLLKSVQIPVWISITPRPELRPLRVLPEGVIRWPAIIDPGQTYTLYLHEDHAANYQTSLFFPEHMTKEWKADEGPIRALLQHQWGRNTRPEAEKPLQVTDSSGSKFFAQRLLTDMWLHSDRDSPSAEAFRIPTGREGIGVFVPQLAVKDISAAPPGPNCPLLGMRALQIGSLTLVIEAKPAGGTAYLYRDA